MSLYSIHFIIALGLSIVVSASCKNPLKKRMVALVCAPIIMYVFFYDYDYGVMGGIFPLFVSYVGAAFAACLSLLLVSFRRIPVDVTCASRPLMKFLFLEIIGSILLCIIFAVPWAIDTFPLSNVEAVLFTVFAGNNAGSEEFVISTFTDKVLIPVLCTLVAVLLVKFALSFALSKKKDFYGAKFCFFKLTFNRRECLQILWQIQKALITIFGVYAAILLLVLPGIIMSDPFKLLVQRPVDSEFYRNDYIHPDSVKIGTPNEPMNLVVIFLESMEKNFARHTPEIVDLEKKSLDFLPGGQNVSGTSWTIAGLTGKLCGIPLNMPMGIEEYLGPLPTHLPYAKCLMNILEEKGYNQLYIQGTNGDFTQKREFWKAHGNVDVHDIKYYKSVNKIPEDYLVFWGFEDRKLYHLAKEELDSLAVLNKPFALYMLTIDTHPPRGYLDDSCRESLKEIGNKDDGGINDA